MKKNKILVLLSYCSIVLLLAGCAKREIENVGSKGCNIICFGDSITFGYGANKGEDYPTALAKLVNERVINVGLDGDTSTEALKRLKSDVLNSDPLLVIIEFCGNDFIKKVPKEETFSNIQKMVLEIQAAGAMVAIVDISAGFFLAEYRSGLQKIAQDNNAIFIPHILSGIITNPSMKSDFLHPNANGYKIIASQVCSSITPYLKENKALEKAKE